MKKYFVYNGQSQTGPFDYKELETNNITKETPIWYEGLDIWTKAGDLPELSELFKMKTPPPFTNSEAPKQNNVTKEPVKVEVKKSRVWPWFLLSFLLLAILAGVMIVNNPNSVPGIKIQVNTPKPMIIDSSADGKNSKLFNAKTTVYASVMNQGGDGNVLVTFQVFQGGNVYDKSKSVYMTANEVQKLEMTFEEVDFISGDITYNVDAIAQ